MPRIFCPTCRQEFLSERSPAMPFCSERCRMVDLGRWLNEEHSITVEKDAELEAFRNDRESEKETAD